MAISSCTPSGNLQESSQVVEGRGWLYGASITTGSGSPATLRLYDGESTDGKLMLSLRIGSEDRTNQIFVSYPIRAQNGIYAEVSGSFSDCVVYLEGDISPDIETEENGA